jgi:hypothetical protein
LGAKGTGTDAQDCLREQLKEVLLSEDKLVAEGVAVMRQMEGIGGPARGDVGVLESNGSGLHIFINVEI